MAGDRVAHHIWRNCLWVVRGRLHLVRWRFRAQFGVRHPSHGRGHRPSRRRLTNRTVHSQHLGQPRRRVLRLREPVVQLPVARHLPRRRVHSIVRRLSNIPARLRWQRGVELLRRRRRHLRATHWRLGERAMLLLWVLPFRRLALLRIPAPLVLSRVHHNGPLWAVPALHLRHVIDQRVVRIH